MLKYEKMLSTPKLNNTNKLKAAQFFANLSPISGFTIEAPDKFTQSYYKKNILPNLSSTERKLFDSIYKLNKGFGFSDYYEVQNSFQIFKNESIRETVISVMQRIGYYKIVKYPEVYKYIEAAKQFFKEVVTSEPNNAAAWKAYAENYYLVEPNHCHPCLRERCVCPESQKEIIRKAHHYNRDDLLITTWYNLIDPTRISLPDSVTLDHYNNSNGSVSIALKRGYNIIDLSPKDFELFKKAYTLSNNSVFILNNMHLDKNTEEQLIELFDAWVSYQNKFCSEIIKHSRIK